MSETETESTTEPTQPEPVEPDTGEPVEPQPGEETPEPGQEPAEPSEPSQEPPAGTEEEAQLRSEKELERAHKQIDKLREHVANRVGAILGEDAQILMPCPACGDEIPGFVWPPDAAPVAPEKIGALSSYIGLPDLTLLEDAKDATQCPDCKGRGNVKTQSLVPNYTSKTCSLCVGKGYTGTGVFIHPEQPTTNGQQTEQPAYVPPVETALPPEAEALRRQGFLVIPPTQPIVVP